jgi:hypothetical protein
LISANTERFINFLKENENILVILENLSKSYLMSGNGTSMPAIINQPEGKNPNQYTYYSRSAIVKDKLYIFGGKSDSTRVRTMSF